MWGVLPWEAISTRSRGTWIQASSNILPIMMPALDLFHQSHMDQRKHGAGECEVLNRDYALAW